jgi:ferritin
MPLNVRMQESLNEHLTEEFYASYLYLSMSAFCESKNLPGFAHWLRIQSQEEYSHAMNLYDFILDRQGNVVLHPIGQPTIEFESLLDVMRKVLEHERGVTEQINRLYQVALQEEDYATQVHLQWFISEQVEEEKVASDIVEQLAMIGNDTSSLLLLDRELATRTLTPAPNP